MYQARSRHRPEPKAELKETPARQRRWGANLVWTMLNVAAALLLLGVFLNWDRSARQARENGVDGPRIVQPPPEESYEPVQLIARADAHLSASNPVVASQLYRRAIRGQPQVPNTLTYRMAVSFELSGESEDAMRLYRGVAGKQDSPLAFAAQLGQARLYLHNGQLDACHEILSRMAAVSALRGLQASRIADDVAYLLAMVRAAKDLDSMPRDALALDSVEAPAVVFSAVHLLELAAPSEDRATGQDASQAPQGMHVDSLTNEPNTTILTANFSGVGARDVLESTAQVTQWVISLSDEARLLIEARTVRLHLQDTTAASMLTLLLEPLDLVWTYHNQTLVIRRAAELPEGRAAVSERQTEQSLRTALAFYPNHVLAPHAHVTLGNIAFFRNELDRAASIYREVTQRFPSHPTISTALFNLAKTQYLQQRWTEATRTFYRLIDERNGHHLEPVAYLFLGRLYLESNDIASAKRALSRAASLATAADTLSTSSLTLAAAYLMLGNNYSANLELMKHRDAFQKESTRNLASLLSAVARFRAASLAQEVRQRGRDLTAAVVHVTPTDFFGDFGYLLLGDVYTELGLADQVAITYQDALERGISSPIRDHIMFRLAMHWGDLDQRTKCRELLEAVVESKSMPWSAKALLELARLSLREESLAECRRRCQQVLAEPMFAGSRSEVLRILGHVYERQDDHYNAAVCFAGLTPGDLIEPPSETRK